MTSPQSNRSVSFTGTSVLLLSLFTVPPSLAAWPHSPGTNVPISTATADQAAPQSVSDGAGGAIIVWEDRRNDIAPDIYVQRVRAAGTVDPGWPSNGRALCTAAFTQFRAQLVSDGAGGAIVTWEDQRNGSDYDIYAQHVLASGAVDPAWPANGRLICGAPIHQQLAAIVSDGAGGAIITWDDYRNGPGDIYAQRVLASGVVDGAWPVNGRALCTAANNQLYPQIVSDGAGGAIVTWQDERGASIDIYAQHVLSSGAVDGAWPADGRALCTSGFNQQGPTIVGDGVGGAIVTWYDRRSGAYDIHAQHVLASGVVDGAWPVNGLEVCTAAGDQTTPRIASDGAGGAIITWDDLRSSAYDIHAQHVLASGAVDGAWPVNGQALCTATGTQADQKIVSDGAGGAIVTWLDRRAGADDMYAQHVLASGAVDGAWPEHGQALCTAANNQSNSAIVSDGVGGAIVAWTDFRTGTNSDIYAQRVAPSGYLGNPEPAITSVRDIPNDNGGKVKLSWNASYLDTDQPYFVDHYWIFRSVPQTIASQALTAGAHLLKPRDAEPAGPGQAYRTTTVNGVTYYWEFIASTPAAHFTSAYSYAAPTTSDSIGAGNPRTAFLVVAYNTSNTVYLVSNPDSGYSVDNVAPFAPAPFTGIFNGGGPHLHWGASTASDFASYRLYRDTAITFTPGPGNLVAALPDTGFVDMGSTWSYYKLSAVDSHGNESGFALLTPSGSFQQQTPAGSNVQVALASNVNLTFQNVTSGGTSQLSLQTGGPAPPVGLKLVPTSPKLFYELSTTATFTGTVTVCITYDPATVKQSEANLKLMHYDTALQPPTWVQVTASRDTAANQICGTVTHFSSFALMEVDATVGVEEALTGSRPFISCAPNPISGPAQIGFDLPATTSVRLGLFDLQGRLVRELERNPRMGAGRHVVRWDGLSTRGEKLSAGVYFLRLEAERFSQSRRVVVAR